MDWKDALTKALLQIAIGLLAKSVPFLAGLLGGPFGFIASWAMGQAVSWLYDAIDRYLLFAGIDRVIAEQLAATKVATEAFRNALKPPAEGSVPPTEKEKADALEEFRKRVIALGKLKLQ